MRKYCKYVHFLKDVEDEEKDQANYTTVIPPWLEQELDRVCQTKIDDNDNNINNNNKNN